MGLRFNLTVILESEQSGFSADTLGPVNLEIARGGQAYRRYVELDADIPRAIPVDGLVPWMVVVYNVHASTTIELSFGQGADHTIQAGDPPNIINGTKVPTLKAVGAAGKALVWIVEA